MTSVLFAVAGVLGANMLASVWRIGRGPHPRDRLSGLLLLATTGAAVLVVLATALQEPALRDAALATAALATVVAVVRISGERHVLGGDES